MKRIALIALCLSISGCGLVAQQRFEDWYSSARPRAEAGELAWSEYYKQGYEEAGKLPDTIPGKGFAMLQAATLIDAALAMESGAMPAEEFFSLQRKARAQMLMHQEQAAAQQQAMFQQWMQTQAYIQQAYRPATPAPVNCQTYKLGNTLQTNCQ